MHKKIKNIIAITLTCMMTIGLITSNTMFCNRVAAKEINLSDKQTQNITVNDAIEDIVKYYENGYLTQIGKNINVWQWAALKKAGVKDFDKWEVTKKVKDLESKVLSLRLAAKAKQSMILMDLDEDPSNFEGMNLINDIVDDINEMLKDAYVSSISKPGSQAEAKAVTAINRFNKIYPKKKIEFKTTKLGTWEGKVDHKDDELIVNEMAKGENMNGLRDYIEVIQMLSYYKDKENININENLNKFLKLFKDSLQNDGGLYSKVGHGEGIYATFTQIDFVNMLLRIDENPFEWVKDKCNLIDGLFIKWDGKCFRNYDDLKDIGDLDRIFYILTCLKEKGYGNYELKGVNFKNIDYTKEALVQKVEISAESDKNELEIGEQIQFTANIIPENAVNKDIAWISHNRKVIDIDKNGLATAVGAGETTICIWITKGDFVESNIYKLKVKEKRVTGIEINKNKLELSGNELARLSARVLPENASNKNVIWSSNDEKIVKVDKKGLLTAMGKGTAIVTVETVDGSFKDECQVIVTDKQGNIENNYETQANKVIDEICKNIDMDKIDIAKTDLERADYWTIFDLSKDGKQLPKDCLKNIKDKIKNNKEIITTSNCAKITLATLAAGGNPTDIGGVNLIKKIYNGNMRSIYDYSFGLIALDSGNFGIPYNSKWNRDKIINNILANATSDNGWAFSGSKAEIDTTAMVITALAPYYSRRNDVKNAIDKAVKILSLRQGVDASFTNFDGNENSNSVAMVIIALCENGIDVVKDERFIKGGNNLIDVLMQYRTEDGKGFGFTDKKYNNFATEQGLRSLIAYKNLKENKGSIYKFDIVSDEKTFRIQNLTDNEEIKLGQDGKIRIKATNISNESKDASLIIGLFDENGQLVDYVATKQNIQQKEDTELMGMISLPKSGKYILKGFVWNNLKNMNPLSNVIEVNVK